MIDLRPLAASRSFREIWYASLLTGLAGQIAAVAALAQVWSLTNSVIWTGAIGLAQAVPMLVFGAVGGSLADRYDRRTIVLFATLGQAGAAILLTSQAIAGNRSPMVVVILLAVQAAAGAVGSPARRTLPVRLLPTELVSPGLALHNIGFQASMLIGPAIGGLLIAAALRFGFLVQAIFMPCALIAAYRLPKLPPDRLLGTAVESGGWSFAVRRSLLRGAFLTDLAATALSMPIAIFPMINALRFDDDPRTLGLFLSAVALGGIVAGMFSGAFTRIERSGVVQLVCAFWWGLALVGFALCGNVFLVLGCLAFAGAADTIGVVTRGGLVQLTTPDAYRGRVSAVEHIIGVAGPEIGNFRGGVLAAAVGAPAALVIGGASAAVAVAVIGATHPALWKYRNRSG